jgi:O-antigen ligase
VLGSFVREGHIRSNAGWDYPTMLAAFLCLGGFFVVHLLWQRWRWPGLLIGGVLVTAAVIATQSRSGLLGLGAGAVAYLVLQRRLSQVIRVLGGLIAAGAALLLIPGLAPSGFRSFLSQSLEQGSSANANVQYRQDLYHAAGAAMSHSPVWGYGWGSGKSVATNALNAYFGPQVDLASLPVSLGVELGYVGAGAVGLFLLLVVVQLARHRDVPGRLPIGAGIVGCSVAMLGVPVSPPLSWMLLVAALGWSVSRTWQAQPPTTDAPSEPTERDEVALPRNGLWVTGGATR